MFRRFKNLKNSGIHKKLVTLVVTSFIVINSTVIPIHAAPSYDATNVAQLKQAVENRLSQFNKNDITNYTGELGIFYNGKRIISQAIWTEFINSPRAKVLDIDESVKKYQNEQMIEILKTFNESYFVDDKTGSDGKDGFLSLTLDKDDVDKNKFYAGRIAQDLAKYINEYLDKQLSDFKNNKEELVNAKRLELRYIYDIVNAPIDDIKAINALLPQTANTDKSGATTFSKDPYSIGNTCSPLTDIMKASDKSQVLRLAQEINKDEMSEIGVDNIDNNLNLIDRFYKGGSQNNEELINTYYLMMSASSVYEPFISHVGDDYFKRALLKVAGEDDKTGAIWKLYTDANLYKKPLYMREIDRDGKVSGTAERVTLDKFVTSVLDGESGALVMPVGMVVKGKDSNSYNIYNTDRFKWTKGDSETNKKKVQAQEGPQTGNNQANTTPTPGTGINGSGTTGNTGTGQTPNNGTGSSTSTDGSVVTPSNDGSNMAGAQAPEDDAVNNYIQQNTLHPNGGQT
ncbi:hypothetical protein, partial [Paraclostridium bifermentans]|uniref:hypothetical protein n=1 Tax=Paraclostridium bifermentans TaxID=1490 RepID=UPI00374FCFC8